MVGLIALGLVLSRVIGHTNPEVSDDRAVVIAQSRVDFTPEGHNIRFVRRGVPPRPFWAVSFWIRNSSGGYKRLTLVVVDANTGRVTEVRRST